MKLLIIDDDHETAATLVDELSDHFTVDVAFNGEDAEYLLSVHSYDLLLLDYILPDTNGLELCKKIRQKEIRIPILMLTGENSIDKKVSALNTGTDDYLTKPYSIEELIARIRALLRRSNTTIKTNALLVDDLSINLDTKVVQRAGKEIPLRRKEFDILEYLMRNPGRVISREMLLDQVWDSSHDSLTNIIDVHINSLRDRVDKPFPKKLIKTVHGFGYKIQG
jgi:DNA-binding response OmpR family regulator